MNRDLDTNLDHHLEDRLRSLADSTAIGTTDVGAIIGAARHRSRRRHRAVASFAVVAVAGVTAVGVQQLARVDDSGASNVPPPDSTGGTSPDTIPVDAQPVAASGALPLVPSNITWTTVDVDSAAALGFRQFSSPGVGYAISTAPGTGGPDSDPSQTLYRSSDGISWDVVMTDLAWPFAYGNHQFVSSSAGLYALGTVAAAAGEANALQLGVLDPETADWTQIDLPFDQADYDTENTITPVTSAVFPIDGGVMVVLGVQGANPRGAVYEPLTLEGGYASQSGLGIETFVDSHCNAWEQAEQQAAENGVFIEPVTVPAEADANGSIGECVTELQTWEELGLLPDDIASIARPGMTLAYTVIDGVVTELAVPFAGTAQASHDNLLTVAGPSDAGNSFYLVQPNATFRGVLADAATDGVSVAVSDQAAIAVDYAGNVTFESFATGSVTRRDFSNLLLPDGSKPDGVFPSDGFVGYGGGFVGLLNLESFVEGASGSTATAMAYESDAPPATGPPSSVPLTPAVTTVGYPVVGAPVSTVVHDPGLSSLMLVTTDGQSMSAESIVDLVGLPYGSFWVNDISVMNGQILVSYVEYDDDPETPNPTRVLVGTPNT